MVETSFSVVLRPACVRSKKKDEPRIPSVEQIDATACAKALLPVPAPSQTMKQGGQFASLEKIHFRMVLRS